MNYRQLAMSLTLGFFMCTSSAHAQEEIKNENSYELSANVTLASDYIFRGVSQTMDDPAIQGGFDISHKSGFFVGVWSSNVDFVDGGPDDDEADFEVDFYGGFGFAISESFSFDTTLIRYIYPGTASGFDLDYTEILAALHYQEYLTVTVGYSDDAFGTDEEGIYYEMLVHIPLPYEFTLNTTAGYYDLDNAYDDSYSNWGIGIERTYDDRFSLELGYSDTDGDGEDIFGDAAEGRTTLRLTAVF